MTMLTGSAEPCFGAHTDEVLHLMKQLLHKDVQENVSDVDLLYICISKQRLLEKETMECLLMLSRVYTEVFILSKQNKLDEAAASLARARKVMGKFELTSAEKNILKILTYPRISYYYYKVGKYAVAKRYLSVAIGANAAYAARLPYFYLFTFQQQNNYVVLHFKTDQYAPGIRLLISNISGMLRAYHSGHGEHSGEDLAQTSALLRLLLKDSAGILIREVEKAGNKRLFDKYLEGINKHELTAII